MKLSKFNIYLEKEDNLIIYNTYSGGVLKLDEEYKSRFEESKEMNFLLENENCDLLEELKKGRMLVECELDETNAVKIQSSIHRFNATTLSLTIAPTMECNFHCPYCYENGKRYNTMSKEVVDRTISFIKTNMRSSKNLNITWYGGEPLLELDIIKKITNSIESRNHYKSTIVTNGYLLTEENARILKSLNIQRAQVTIDGPPEIHNARRRLSDGGDTFFVILNNIERAINYIEITIRINVDKTNMIHANAILDHLENRGILNKVNLYLAPVDNVNSSCNAPNCYKDFEFALEEIKFIENNHKRKNGIVSLPGYNPYICGAVSSSSFVIGPLGDIYKCWDQIGYSENSIGNVLDEEISMFNSNHMKWLGYETLYYSSCRECKVLPVCMSGCPYKNLVTNVQSCDSIRYNAKSMIEIYNKILEEEV